LLYSSAALEWMGVFRFAILYVRAGYRIWQRNPREVPEDPPQDVGAL